MIYLDLSLLHYVRSIFTTLFTTKNKNIELF